jgi:hypothetical protein
MLCSNCYEAWLQARPIGAGASCLCCGDRRRVHLRYFELAWGFIVLCHNCAARAAAVRPLPRTPEGLVSRLTRDRRHGERRKQPMSRTTEQKDRRHLPDRRVGLRDLFDATDLAVEIKDEPGWGWPDPPAPEDADVTRIHHRI